MSNPYLVCSDRELRLLPIQWLRAERWEKAGSLLSDIKFTEAKTGRVGVDELLQDYTIALSFLPKENNWCQKLRTISKALDRQAYKLRKWDLQKQPTFFFELIVNEPTARKLDDWQVQVNAELAQASQPYLRELFPFYSDPAELRILIGHSDCVESVALSEDGRLAISASRDNTLKVWNVETGRDLYTLTGHSDIVCGVSLSADGRLAISASADKTLKVWDLLTGRELYTLVGHGGSVNSVALSSDGKLAISASADETLKVWDLSTCHVRYTLTGHKGAVLSVGMSADMNLAISSSTDKTLKVWSLNTGNELHTLKGHRADVECVALSANGKIAISASYSNTVKIWDVTAGRELHTLKINLDTIKYSVALSSDGQLALVASGDKTIKIFDINAGRELCALIGHSAMTSCIALSADGSLAISGSSDKTLKVWDVSSPNVDAFNMEKEPIANKADKYDYDITWADDVKLSADGRLAVCTSRDNTLKVYDVDSGSEFNTLIGHPSDVDSIGLSADGRLSVSASIDRTLIVWDILSGRKLHTLAGGGFIPFEEESPDITMWESGLNVLKILFEGGKIFLRMIFNTLAILMIRGMDNQSVLSVVLSADGRLAISALGGKTLKVWDIATGNELRTLSGHHSVVYDIALNADGSVAVTASKDKTVKVWNVATGKELITFFGHKCEVRRVALSANGQIAVSGDHHGILKVWNIMDTHKNANPSGRELNSFKAHHDQAEGLAISADGRLAVSTSRDETLKIWNINDGRCIVTLPVDVGMNRCAISAEGKTMAAVDVRGKVHFWKLIGADELLAKGVKIEKSWLALKKESESEN